jgi:hypothetical protein
LSAFLLAVLSWSATFSVEDISGRPVQGAAVCDPDGALLAITDSGGRAQVETSEAIRIAALGYLPWTGTVEPGGIVLLEISPVPSGLVVVCASRPSLRDRIPSTTVLGRDELDDLSSNGLRSLPSEAPGVVVREYGGAASIVSVSVRGSDPSQTGWLVDGHSIASTTDGAPSGLLDPSMFGAMEISRGGAPGIPGTGMSATVNLVPELPDSPFLVSASMDDRGGRRFCLRAGLAHIARVSVAGAHRLGEGATSGDETSMLCSIGPGSVSGGLLVSSSAGGVEAPDWAPPTDARRLRKSADAWASLRGGWFECRGGIHAGGMTYRSTEPDTLDTHLNEGRADAGFFPRFADGVLVVEAGLAGLHEWSFPDNSEARFRERATAAIRATRFGSPAVLADFSLDACPGEEGIASARVGLSIPTLDSALVLGASLGRSCRRPTFNELYWPADAFAEGDSTLSPERSFEAGLDLSAAAGPARASIAIFSGRVDDLILWAPADDGIWRPANIGRAEKAGLEGSIGLSMGMLEAGGTLSLLRITDAVDGSPTEDLQLPYRPEATWGGHVRASLTRFSATFGAFGSGLRYMNAANTLSLPAYWIADGSVALDAGRGLGLLLGGSNLLDVEYEESNGFPGMGRTFRAEVSLRGDDR